ncbi:alpha/beta hydrolase [Xanthobacter autotrophicus]|uniref:alpha/beta hydrolase n=1 Tax=Xanthobacter autotrophicus TaxID=280 RepID=UPI0024A7115D|nr:dienelactone hydrolase family protein [Xanthobacter autotrophicus]MDI4657326.1 dienelactone hydrolase family protein [Xanthobacter autotrophicus]
MTTHVAPAAGTELPTDLPIAAGPKIAALSCGKPAWLVVLLHEEGADGQKVIDLALNWAPEMPKADFLAAEAPFPAPSAGPWLDTFLDRMLAERRLPDSHLALVGFSQGAMLALHVGLRRTASPALIIGFCGALPEAEDLAGEIRARPPVLLIHGEEDAVVPFEQMVATRERLKALGVPAKSMRRPGLGHAIDDDGILAAGGVLAATLVKTPAAKADHDHDDHDHDDHDHDHDHDDHDH